MRNCFTAEAQKLMGTECSYYARVPEDQGEGTPCTILFRRN